jgi:hypothetical protein
MKRTFFICAALLCAAAWMPSSGNDALAWTDCREQECTLNIHCVPLCPPCNGQPGDPGVCWYIDK